MSKLDNADFPLQDWHTSSLNVACGIKGQITTVEEKLRRVFKIKKCNFVKADAFMISVPTNKNNIAVPSVGAALGADKKINLRVRDFRYR